VTSGMDELPPRLIEEGRGPAAELLRRFTRQAPHAPGENAAWDATLARLGREAGEHRARLLLALVVGAVAGAAALYAALVPHPAFFAARPAAPAFAPPVHVAAGPARTAPPPDRPL